jgi:hypothetical protein
MFRSQALRAFPRAPRSVFVQQRFATQDYGSGEGSPVGEDPQAQGKNPMSHMEHPGPEAPKVGGSKSSSSSSSPSKSESNSSSSSSSSKSGGEGESQGKEPKAGEHKGHGVKTEGKGKPGAKPKILDEATPVEESESTKKHNEEMDGRQDKPHEQIAKK